jgi:potassium-dependent mechanosensitive channel
MRRLFLCSIFAIWCVGQGSLPAQGLGRLFQGFLASEESNKSGTEPTATEQLVWVGEKLGEVSAQAKTFEEAAFGQKLELAGWPAQRREDFISLAQRQAESWRSSQTMLEQITLQETLHSAEAPPPPPATEEEAALLTSRLRADEARAARANQMIEGNARLTAAVRQSEREARQNLLMAEEKVQSLPETATGGEKESAGLEMTLSQLRLGLEEARLFYLLWNTYGLQIEQDQASRRALETARVLESSGFNKLLQAERLQGRLEALAAEIPTMEKQAREAEKSFEEASNELKELQQAVEQATAQNAGNANALRQSLLARLEQNRRLDGVRAMQGHLVELVEMERTMAQQLMQALESRQLRELEAARQELIRQREEIQLSRPRLEARMAEVDSTLDALQSVTAATEQEKKVLDLLFQRLVAVAANQDQLIEELSGQIRSEDWSSRAVAGGEAALSHLSGVWNFPLFSSDGTVLTLGKLISVLIALGLTLFLSRILARHVGRAATARFRLPESQTHVITTLLFYVLTVVLVLTTLQVLHIPLTVFAFLGGALMVGVGFGSQNLMNNFISGLILLLERKINVGDIVEADGQLGQITHVGSRCSSIRKPDGVEILVPNSFFLEKNVANWTLSDQDHRFDFTIGLAYGTPVEKALELLDNAVRQQPEVLTSPAPLVVFESFGDSALVFRIYYWLRVSQSDGRVVGSQIRTRIDRLCRDNHLAIPFPQREVNLHFPEGWPGAGSGKEAGG